MSSSISIFTKKDVKNLVRRIKDETTGVFDYSDTGGFHHAVTVSYTQLHPAMVKNIWQPGQSANPKGRAMGSRQKLTEKFINDLAANYDRDGMRAIERVAEENPFGYLQIICRLLPKDTHLTISTDLSTSLPPEQLKRIAEAWMISQQEESLSLIHI